MTRARRGALLVGLALLLGGLAAADVSRRERALAERIGPLVDVLVARNDLPAGTRLAGRHLAVRRMPARYVAPGSAGGPDELAGERLAVDVPAGIVMSAALAVPPGPPPAGAPVGRGERAVEIVATGARDLIVTGARVDVLVTREARRGDGSTLLALQDVEVLAARAVDGPGAGHPARQQVAATLRVSLRQAVFLTAAESFARELRLLPRAAADDRLAGGIAVGEALR